MTDIKTFIYAADFETTVYSGQAFTEVWSSAFCPVRTKSQQRKKSVPPCQANCIVHHSIDDSYTWLMMNFNYDIILYYHNLKFDGSFWVDFLLKHGWTYCRREKKSDPKNPFTFETCISDLGMWYYIKLYFIDHVVEIRDSLKLLPMSLDKIGKSFKTRHQKLSMTYEGKRYAGCEITPNELNYICNDVIVLAEALEEMFKRGHNQLTIGSCALSEYKKSIPTMMYKSIFPNLQQIELPKDYGAENADQYIRKAYRGGWCYADQRRTGTRQGLGCTADVNSLYPSMMQSDSGNYYPIGLPHFFKGMPPMEITGNPEIYYFLRFSCSFTIKDNYLPFVQIKNSPFYPGTEMLINSRPWFGGKQYDYINELITEQCYNDIVTLTMTCKDFDLFCEHYHVDNLTYLDGVWFHAKIGIFDDYINKYAELKQKSTGAERAICKLFLNSLYGKLSSSNDSSYKRPVLYADKVIYQEVEEYKKQPLYIAAGSAVTSYARCFTIRAAQKNYDSFCYADTDSIHCVCRPEELKGVPVDPVKFNHWKIESTWDYAYFVRQKTYIEHVIQEDEKNCTPYYNIKAAGLPDRCKDLFIEGMTQTEEQRKQHSTRVLNTPESMSYGPEYQKDVFLSQIYTVEDFKPGLIIPGKLVPFRIPGGIVLKESLFTIR